MTTDSYATVMSTWPYRPETDWVVESSTGEMAASALGWLDDENKVGLVEPAGCGAGWSEVPGHFAGGRCCGPAPLVGDRVVAGAEQGAVEQAGDPSVDPVNDVVRVSPLRRCGTARDRAALVP